MKKLAVFLPGAAAIKALLKRLIITIVLLACACQPARPHHFVNTAFSFDYPARWQLMSELWPGYQTGGEYKGLGVEEIITITSVRKQGQFGIWFTVASAPMPGDLSMESTLEQLYQGLPGGLRDLKIESLTIDGKKATKASYQRPWGDPWWQFQDFWLENDRTLYLLSFHALNNAGQREYDFILDSFSFRD